MQVTNANARLVRSTRALFAQKTRSPPHAHAPNRLGPHQRQRPLLTRIDVPRTHANRIAHARPLAHIGTARFHASTPANMSDAEYEAFLNKASGGQATTTTTTTQQEQKYGTKSVNTAVPRELESVQETYTSDADEPFEAVALEFEGEGEGLGAGMWFCFFSPFSPPICHLRIWRAREEGLLGAGER